MIKVLNFNICFDTKRITSNKFQWRLFKTDDLKNPIKTSEQPLSVNDLVSDLEKSLHIEMVKQGYTGKPLTLFKH